MRVKSGLPCAFSCPAGFHALVLLRLATSSPPSAFSVYPLFSSSLLPHLFCFPNQPLPVNDTSLFSQLFSVSSTLLFFLGVFSPLLFHVHNFAILLPESSLEGGGVLRYHSSVAIIVGDVFASVRNRFDEELEYVSKSGI